MVGLEDSTHPTRLLDSRTSFTPARQSMPDLSCPRASLVSVTSPLAVIFLTSVAVTIQTPPAGSTCTARASTTCSDSALPSAENHHTDFPNATHTLPSLWVHGHSNGAPRPASIATNSFPSGPNLSRRLRLRDIRMYRDHRPKWSPVVGSTSMLEVHHTATSVEWAILPVAAMILVSFFAAIQKAFAFRS